MKPEAASKDVMVESTPEGTRLPAGVLPKLALKNILVPVDFSERSRKAVRYAAGFARQFNAQMLLFHVVEPLPPPAPDYIIGDNLVDRTQTQQAARHLAKWLEAIDSRLPQGPAFKPAIRVGR